MLHVFDHKGAHGCVCSSMNHPEYAPDSTLPINVEPLVSRLPATREQLVLVYLQALGESLGARARSDQAQESFRAADAARERAFRQESVAAHARDAASVALLDVLNPDWQGHAVEQANLAIAKLGTP